MEAGGAREQEAGKMNTRKSCLHGLPASTPCSRAQWLKPGFVDEAAIPMDLLHDHPPNAEPAKARISRAARAERDLMTLD